MPRLVDTVKVVLKILIFVNVHVCLMLPNHLLLVKDAAPLGKQT